jgi:hypothetical protein
MGPLKPLRGRLDRASESIARRGLAGIGKQPHLTIITPDLTDEEIAALTRLLREKIDNDRYPLSPRIQVLKGVLAKFRPEPPRQPLPPPPKPYKPYNPAAIGCRAPKPDLYAAAGESASFELCR